MIVKNLSELEFITYGIEYDPKKFQPVKNRKGWLGMNKPTGGLWASPVDSDWGWKSWCECAEFKLSSFNVWTKFKLTQDSKIIIINSFWDFSEVLREFWKQGVTALDNSVGFDFEKMVSAGYDGIFLTDRGNNECHLPDAIILNDGTETFSDLNSWDCESMVLFKSDKINVLEIEKGY